MKEKTRKLAVVIIVSLIFASGVAVPVFAQNSVYHGADAVFRAEGLTLLWAIVKGSDEQTSVVYVRILANDSARNSFAAFRVVARDVLTGSEAVVVRNHALNEQDTVTESRAAYGDKTQRRFFFYADTRGADGQAPALEIYYFAIPDTAPEFLSQDALEKYFADAARRLGD